MPTATDTVSAALLGEIEQQCGAECRTIIESAEREAEAIISTAYAAARQRGHKLIMGLRREGEQRLMRATAQRDNDMRMAEEARAAAVLRRGCPQLIDAVVARWNVPEHRRAWIEAVAHSAWRLNPGAWTVEHPAAWGAVDERTFRDAVGTAGPITFRLTSDIIAGLRIRSGGAVLDGSPEALLADQPVVEAKILAAIAALSDNGDGSGSKAGGRP